MRFNMKKAAMVVAAVALLGSGSGAFAASQRVEPKPVLTDYFTVVNAGRASALLAEIQKEAAELRSSAQTLASLNYGITWPSHATYLLQVKDHINAVTERLSELQQMQPFIHPWQQQAVAELNTHATKVAAGAQAAIIHLRANQTATWAPEYRGQVRVMSGSSEDLKLVADRFANYEKAQQQYMQLRNQLEIEVD